MGGREGVGHAAELLEREGCTVGGGEGSSALVGRRARAGGGRAALKELELAERKEGNAAPPCLLLACLLVDLQLV